LFSPPQK
jgi:hypothetical protein